MEKKSETTKPKNRTLRLLTFYTLLLVSLSTALKSLGEASQSMPSFLGTIAGTLIIPSLYYYFLLKPKLNDGISPGSLALAKKAMIGFVVILAIIGVAVSFYFGVHNSDFTVEGGTYKNNIITFVKPANENLTVEISQQNDKDTPYYILKLSNGETTFVIMPTALPPANKDDSAKENLLLGLCSGMGIETDDYATCRAQLDPIIIDEKNSTDTSGNTIYEVTMHGETEDSQEVAIFIYDRVNSDRSKSVMIMGTQNGTNLSPDKIRSETYKIINAVTFN